MKRLALFISGTGGNALNLLKACRDGCVAAEVVLAVSSSIKAAGVERLRAEGLPVEVVLRSTFDSDEAFSLQCFAQAEAVGADLICLCGWLKKLVIPGAWEGRILNVHPSLLPAFGGEGMYGMHVHRAVVASGVKETGCTIHLVDNQYDHGRILAQARVPVMPGDSPEDVQKRVYAQEMRLYPDALQSFIR
jgi:formyltetrahydrofolate-dependent phosphoribosylglycinamide formyltransferase